MKNYAKTFNHLLVATVIASAASVLCFAMATRSEGGYILMLLGIMMLTAGCLVGWRLKAITQLMHLHKDLDEAEKDIFKLVEVAVKDPLTNLLNRRGFDLALETEIDRSKRSGKPFSIVLLDLDNFKYINDNHGHPAGDEVLKQMSSRLSVVLRKVDMFARIGGDEFMIILPLTDSKAALLVAHKLHNAMNSQPFQINGAELKVTASIGVSSCPKNGFDRATLHDAVDAVMYKAKHQGRNCVVSLEIEDQYTFHSLQESNSCNIRQAITAGDIELALQPIAQTKNGEFFAYEALARLRKSNGEFVKAEEFIEYAEAHGLVKEIDDCIFRKGIERLGILGPDMKMFFNFSPASFVDKTWMRSLPHLVKSAGVRCEQVVIEITEREALPNMEATDQIIKELRQYGIKFAIDDFGSGFSSFLYVRQFEVDYLKIDGGFVRNMVREANDRIIVQSIQFIAESFGIQTIAEFVEDEETATILKDMGIDFVQGYLYGKPLVEERDRLTEVA